LGVVVSPNIERLAHKGKVARLAARVITLLLLMVMAIPALVGINYFVPLYYRHIWLMW